MITFGYSLPYSITSSHLLPYFHFQKPHSLLCLVLIDIKWRTRYSQGCENQQDSDLNLYNSINKLLGKHLGNQAGGENLQQNVSVKIAIPDDKEKQDGKEGGEDAAQERPLQGDH